MDFDKKNKFFYACIFSVAATTFFACTHTKNFTKTTSLQPTPVIFETDLGNDVDDAMALDMLYKYEDKGLIHLIAVSTNKNSKYSARCIDVLNTWYGYPKIPVGEVKSGANSEGDSHNYAQSVCNFTPAFKQSNKDSFPESVALYRKVLAKQKDSSVVIISTGFSTNLAKLLASPPDEYSSLNGKELIAKKVKLLSMMAGNFEGKKMIEYNVLRDVPAAKQVFENFPCKVVTSPFELGDQILYPASSIEHDFTWTKAHPVVVAYKSYLPMPYDRPTWDLTAVLYAVEGVQSYFNISKKGTIQVDEKGYTTFTENENNNRQYLEVNHQQAELIKQHFLQMISAEPKHFKQ